MRLVKAFEKLWKVYDNEEDLERDGIVPKELQDAREGDYVRDTNGISVPVIKFAESVNKYNKTVWRWTFPNDSAMRVIITDKPKFNYIYNPDRNRVRRIADVKLEVMINLIKEGFDVYDAARIAYGKNFDTKYVDALMLDASFVTRIKDSKALMGLRDTFKDRGLTEERIADTLLESLDSESFSEKKWAVELALKYLDNTEVTTTQKFSMQIEASKINDILLQKVPSVLAQASEHVLPSGATSDYTVL